MTNKQRVNTEKLLKGMLVVCWVVFIGLLINTGGLLVSFGISWVNPEASKNLFRGLDLYELYQHSFWTYTQSLSFLVVMSGIKAYIAFLGIKILSKVTIKRPFLSEVVRVLEKSLSEPLNPGDRLTVGITLLGALDQPTLAAEMRASGTFILPSFYEGLPLVLVEAAACGCRLISTALPGVQQTLADPFEDRLLLVSLPPMASIDAIDPAHESQFIGHLTEAMRRSIAQHAPPSASVRCQSFTWNAVAQRIESIWHQITT